MAGEGHDQETMRSTTRGGRRLNGGSQQEVSDRSHAGDFLGH
jgi:hypothetical protein